MPDFEVFKAQSAKLAGNYVTIGMAGQLHLSAAAWHALGDPAIVELLFDPDAQVIGFRSSESSAGFRVSTQRAISGVAFLRYYGIEFRSMRFLAVMRDDVLCVDVSRPDTPVGKGVQRTGGQP